MATVTDEERAKGIAVKLASFYFAEGEDAEREQMAARIMKYVGGDIAEALTTAADETWERAIAIASDPYGDEVQCFGSDEPKAVSRKIVDALDASRKASS